MDIEHLNKVRTPEQLLVHDQPRTIAVTILVFNERSTLIDFLGKIADSISILIFYCFDYAVYI